MLALSGNCDRSRVPRQYVSGLLRQGIFRVVTTEAYDGACAVTGEHSLPALEAAHIRPYSEGGPHAVANGLLLRADLHRLFDRGYVTVTPEGRLRVGKRLYDEFQNGHTYRPPEDAQLSLPKRAAERPSPDLLRWHNEEVFVA